MAPQQEPQSSVCYLCGIRVAYIGDPLGKYPVTQTCGACGRRTCRSCGVNEWDANDCEQRTCRLCCGTRHPKRMFEGPPQALNLAQDRLYWPLCEEPAAWRQAALAGARARTPAGELVAELGSPVPSTRIWAAFALRRFGSDASVESALEKALQDADPVVRAYATASMAAGARGADLADDSFASSVTETLVRALTHAGQDKEWYVRLLAARAWKATCREEPSAVRSLLVLLADPLDPIRREARDALANAPRAWAKMLPRLEEMLGTGDETVVSEVAAVLSSFYPPPSSAYSSIRSAFERARPPALRAQLGTLLAKLMPPEGEDAGPQVSAALRMLTSHAGSNRAEGARSLAKLGRASAPAIPKLLELMVDSWPSVGESCIAALAAIGTAALNPLRKVLQGSDVKAQTAACRALGTMGNAAQAAVPELASLLHATDAPLAAASSWALANIGGAALEPLGQALGDAREIVRESAASMSQDVARAIPESLRKLASDPSAKVRLSAVRTLGRLRPLAGMPVRDLMTACKDLDKSVRAGAVESLRACQEFPSDAVAGAADLLGTPNAAEFVALEKSLAGCEASIPVLEKALEHPNAIVRKRAAGLLGRMSRWGPRAFPSLIRTLTDSDPNVRKACIEAIGKLGPDENARTALEAVQNDPVASVKFAAMAALKRMTR